MTRGLYRDDPRESSMGRGGSYFLITCKGLTEVRVFPGCDTGEWKCE